MASPVSFGRWMLRDFLLAKVVLVWIVFGFSIFFYFSDGSPPRRAAAGGPQSSNANNVNKNDNAKIYTGSIIVVPERGDRCSELGLDNRTGKMWDKGFVNCYEAVLPSSAQNQHEGMSGERLRAIKKTFHPDGD